MNLKSRKNRDFARSSVLIPQHLIDFLGEARVKIWKVLPKSDDGTTLVLWCPDNGDYGSKFIKLFSQELNRKIECIPVNSSMLCQVISKQIFPKLVENCFVKSESQCPKTWQSFELTDESTVRFCSVCNKNIYLCNSPDEIRHFENKGKCMAIRNFSYAEMLEGIPYWD